MAGPTCQSKTNGRPPFVRPGCLICSNLLDTNGLFRCGPLATILNDTLSHCQNSTTLEAAHLLLHCLALDPRLNQALDTPVRLEDVLDDLGFSGLWRSCSMDSAHEQDRKYFTLTERLIEVS